MIFIIGGNGLTGSAIVQYMQKTSQKFEIIQRENKEEYFGKECNILIFANGNAVKYKANQDPFFDFNASVTSIAEYIHKIKFKKFILISTVDVYNNKSDTNQTQEDVEINFKKLDTYGFHKYLTERYVMHFCDDYLIFRLPGLVGTGLKKNPVFDYINPEKRVMISPESELNFINTRHIAKTIFKMLKMDLKNEIFNLASKNSIKIKNIKNIIGNESEFTEDAKNNIQKYQINTNKIQNLVELSTSEEAIEEYFRKL
ncbi:NAD-dependent epimerase/dehydratase family protein [Nitrosopumilus sp. K4]|uniref:NAD-dependent epimerase/dehydratase family protein n=1 Tax=Nitrosopumilus sp. K4 TaxID=2795383 RepID=UPI001BADF908|nr:NAD-dependent epimerase/dehydratase family protein [Nitrosopumilus sp. K4]QUC64785.1 NAD-dependent epimerase/dehydratase family protein [Nitrosopumilus sp. K4]